MKEGRLLDLIKAPVVSEKATQLAETQRQFVFKVAKDASKPEIKAAVESLFEVKVKQIQVLIVKGKVKRKQRAKAGKRPDWKKAYVTLDAGYDIDLMAAE